ncbi:MAG: YeeE/YedE family protein [Planctomycetota bacterium]
MSAEHNRIWYRLSGAFFLLAPLIVALLTGHWVCSAIPLGFIFGFCMHKGNLCPAAACSEVVLMRDARKLFGLWVCIVVSMLGFAMLEATRLVTLAPQHAYWANDLLGGALFGTGMTLAGGCVSGSLFKAASGHVNSMAALVGIPLGALAVQSGPLRPLNELLMKLVWHASDGGPLTLSSLTGVPFGWLAAIVALGTGAVILRRVTRRRLLAPAAERRVPAPAGVAPASEHAALARDALEHSWKPWQAGLGIGVLSSLAYLSSAASGRNYPWGVASGVVQLERLVVDRDLIHVYERGQELRASGTARIEWWEVLLVVSFFAGAWVSARLSGDRLTGRPPEEIMVAFFGGCLTGLGLAIGFGCTIGHGISGWALMSVGSVLFCSTLLLASWATTCAYLMGGFVWPKRAGPRSDE